jgi:MFS family permease
LQSFSFRGQQCPDLGITRSYAVPKALILADRRGSTVALVTSTGPPSSKANAGQEWAAGWHVVLAAACGVGTGWHFFQIVSGLFMIPMQTEFGWSRSAASIGPLGGLISIIFYPFAGMLIDRYGPRPIAIAGLCLLGFGFLILSAMPANPLMVYSAVAYLAAAGSISNQIVFAKGLATWFSSRFGAAIGLMMTGVTLTTALGIPLLAQLIARFGWRAGFVSLAVAIAVIGLPINLVWFRTQSNSHTTGAASVLLMDTKVTQALRDRRFWLLLTAVGCAAVPIGGFLAHLQAILIGHHFSISGAASFGSVFVISIGLGRLVFGTILDRTRPAVVASGSLCLAALGAFLLAQLADPLGSPILVAVLVGLIGLAQGAESDYLSYFALRIFGISNFSKLVGLISMAVGGGMAVGGFLFAALFDHYHDYHVAVRIGSALYLIAASIFPLIRISRSGPALRAGGAAIATMEA